MKINKYDWLTNELLATYNTIQEAVFDNHICYGTIYKQLDKSVLEINRGRSFTLVMNLKRDMLLNVTITKRGNY